jgi:hypothetical protein
MEKLKNRKAEVDEQLDRTRGASARSETAAPVIPTTPPRGPIGEPILEGGAAQEIAQAAAKVQAPSLAAAPKEAERESYTNRLLKAKQRVWEEREKDQEKKPPQP